MPRKTEIGGADRGDLILASMRPRPDAAENHAADAKVDAELQALQ